MNLGGVASPAYKPLQAPDDAVDESSSQEDDQEEQFQDESEAGGAAAEIAQSTRSRIEPLEMGSSYSSSGGEEEDSSFREGFVWTNLTLTVTIFLVVPSLVIGIVIGYKLSGRIWTCSLFSMHLTLSLMKAYYHFMELRQGAEFSMPATSEIEATNMSSLPSFRDNVVTGEPEDPDTPDGLSSNNNGESPWEPPVASETESSEPPPRKPRSYFLLTSIPSVLDILLFGGLYRLIIFGFRNVIFVDSDGEPVLDWIRYYKACKFVLFAGYLIAIARFIIATCVLSTRYPQTTYYSTTCYYLCNDLPVIGSCLRYFYKSWLQFKAWYGSPPKAYGYRLSLLKLGLGSSFLLLAWCIYSLFVHFALSEPWFPHNDPDVCDPLDKTECCLPFPSYFHVRPDSTTETGWRVHLQPETFPTLKGRIPIPVDFLNSLDGFSTMGPILFYVDGMKESHEQYIKELQADDNLRTQKGFTRLRGHEELGVSLTPYSTTLLVDVAAKELVPHSAEIDYLDPKRPIVMVFPAQPLKHATQYAVAVINATDANGKRFPPTPGLLDLLDGEGSSERKELFTTVLLPALEEATSKIHSAQNEYDWGGPVGAFVRSKDPHALQLMFDFHTASKKSQLGNARAVRDHSLKYIEDHWKHEWHDHVRVVRQEDGDCLDEGYPLARTIHGELDVPWYLSGFGPGYRNAKLDSEAVSSGVPKAIGKAKFVVKVPCSLRAAVASIDNSRSPSRDLNVVVEFGHGLFYNRAEVGDDFLIRMADRSGYILTAMDWRGMSQYDFPIVAKTMLSDPSLFETVRDNLIQGYANKFALQHFTQNGMLDMDWLKFRDIDGRLQSIPHTVTAANNGTTSTAVRSAFYGISQGGILGAGYLGLSGATGLIPQGVLGVPGTPFSLILSRSLEFVGYDVALLLNFYNNRHVRIFLSLAQMCWDSVEAAGVLGQPIEEPLPSILMQAGLGDPIVPTLSAERLARAINARIFPDNPRQIWMPDDYNVSNRDAVFTEMLYKKEYNKLPEENRLVPAPSNSVHICVRLEPVLQAQIEEFLNHNNFTDPCALEGKTACIKKRADC